MSSVLSKARILSSDTNTDNTVSQSQQTDVNIKITPSRSIHNQSQISQPYYPSIPSLNPQSNPQTRDINFTIPEENSQYQFQPPTNNISQNPLVKDRGIADLGNHIVAEGEARNEIEDLTLKNKFLELLVEMYEDNPLKINSYVVCKSSLLMNMIKLLTNCDKVDFVLEDEEPGCCLANVSKMIKIDKILVTKDGKSEELKYCYNHVYTELVRYGVSLKLCI